MYIYLNESEICILSLNTSKIYNIEYSREELKAICLRFVLFDLNFLMKSRMRFKLIAREQHFFLALGCPRIK